MLTIVILTWLVLRMKLGDKAMLISHLNKGVINIMQV